MNSSQPNILFIFADQLSARWLPVYGNHTVKAPVLQDLASKSSVFTQAYTNSPLCTPYRACLLTGLYASQTQVTENGQCFDDDQKTLAHYLNDLNYETHYIGKWHLSGAPHKNRWIPPNKRAGFKHFIGWESHHVDHNKGLIWKDNPDNHIELKGHETDGLTEIVCQELKEINQNKPFFMTVSYQAPHAPSSPPKKYYDLYNSSVLDDGPNTDKKAWFKNDAWSADYDVEEFRKLYYGEITHLDAAIGNILKTLTECGLDDNTVIFFTADHGDMAGCHNLFGKGVMYDESVRVPLMVYDSRQHAQTIEHNIDTVDIHTTILDTAGYTNDEHSEGRSFLPILKGTKVKNKDIFIEYKDDCIIRDQIKIITKKNSDKIDAIFNLKNDPYETNNLIDQFDPEVKERMLKSLKEWRKQVRS